VIAAGLSVAFTTFVCATLLAAAALTPAPALVLPLVIVACLGCPMLAMFAFASTLADLRRDNARLSDPRAIEELRRQIRHLPETQHPLGL
jgi:hypothetical protein